MKSKGRSIRTFIGAKDFNVSRRFYRDLGFEEVIVDRSMSFMKLNDSLGFYLQDYYVEDWINNLMIFLEVEDFDVFVEDLLQKELHTRFDNVRFTNVKEYDWGREIFMHDPSGVLWHFGEFYKKKDR